MCVLLHLIHIDIHPKCVFSYLQHLLLPADVSMILSSHRTRQTGSLLCVIGASVPTYLHY